MNATRRGISHHELCEMIDRTAIRLRRLNITGREADRAMIGLVLGACGFTPEQCTDAVGRLFPPRKEPAHE